MENNVISKELFSEVIDENLDLYYCIEFYNVNNSIRYWIIEDPTKQSTSKYINIHELARKCKEWAYDNGYRVIEIQKGIVWVVPKQYNILISFNYSMIKYQDTDIESACQWIYDNKDK